MYGKASNFRRLHEPVNIGPECWEEVLSAILEAGLVPVRTVYRLGPAGADSRGLSVRNAQTDDELALFRRFSDFDRERADDWIVVEEAQDGTGTHLGADWRTVTE